MLPAALDEELIIARQAAARLLRHGIRFDKDEVGIAVPDHAILFADPVPVGVDLQALLRVVPVLGARAAVQFHFFRSRLVADKPVVLSVGGSLGAGTINKSIMAHIDEFEKAGIQLIWQTGKYYYDNIMSALNGKNYTCIHPMAFVKRMDLAYKAADVVVSRSGALSVSELCLAAKPVIFIPSPNVAEDHQTKNAMALVEKDAAVLLPDAQAEAKFFDEVSALLSDDAKKKAFSDNIAKLAVKDSADLIAKEIMKIVK